MALIEIFIKVNDVHGSPIEDASIGVCRLDDLSEDRTMNDLFAIGRTNHNGCFASYEGYNDDRHMFYRVRHGNYLGSEGFVDVEQLHGTLYRIRKFVVLRSNDAFISVPHPFDSVPELTEALVGNIVWV